MVVSYGCHYNQSLRVVERLNSWRLVFDECGRCGRGKSRVRSGQVEFMLCVPLATKYLNLGMMLGDTSGSGVALAKAAFFLAPLAQAAYKVLDNHRSCIIADCDICAMRKHLDIAIIRLSEVEA